MDIFLIKATQLILALALLVIIHEFGHFLFARIFGIRVEKFYIFFNPITSLFKWRPGCYTGVLKNKSKLKKSEMLEAEEAELLKLEEKEAEDALVQARKEAMDKFGNTDSVKSERWIEKRVFKLLAKSPYKRKRGFWKDTEYGLGWIPLGGYCKISGMIDESMDTEQMSKPAKHWEFRAKPAWQRLLVMIAGVLFNFLLAILIYAGIVFATGEKYVPLDKAEMGFAFSPESQKIGFKDGDMPLKADGKKLPENPAEARMEMLQAKTVTVNRDGVETDVEIPGDFAFKLEEEAQSGDQPIMFYTYRFPARITQVSPGEGAEKAGLKKGDEIIAINGKSTPTLPEFITTLNNHENQNVDLTIVRRQSEKVIPDTLNVAAKLNGDSKLGIGLEVNPAEFYDTKEIHYGLVESLPRGIELGTTTLTSYVKSMKMIFTKDGAKSIGGFGAIGSIFPEKWNWIAFWNIAAFLSVALAFMNILPIPALDGGHVLFLLIEVITGRKPSQKVLEIAQWIGMVLLIGLLIYANGMDIYRFFIK